MFQLTRMSTIAIFCSGLILGAALVIFLGASDRSAVSAAKAADAKTADAPGFQVSGWAFGGYSSPNGTEHEPAYGSYIVDMHSGEIWLVIKDGKPKRIGRAE